MREFGKENHSNLADISNAAEHKSAWVSNGLRLASSFRLLVLIFMVRIVGKRPGKQITPFEFILIFFLGGLTLTGMVGDEVSLTSAFCQIITIACCHYSIAWLRMKSPKVAQMFDGTLLDQGRWRSRTMEQMRIQPADLMSMARDQGMKVIGEVEAAVLERNGEISLIKKEES